MARRRRPEDEDKETFRETARLMRPDLSREQFDRFWRKFLRIRRQMKKLQAMGVAIHPCFGQYKVRNPKI